MTPEDVVSDWCDYTSGVFMFRSVCSNWCHPSNRPSVGFLDGQKVWIASGYTDQGKRLMPMLWFW